MVFYSLLWYYNMHSLSLQSGGMDVLCSVIQVKVNIWFFPIVTLTQSQLKLFCFNEQVYFSCPHHLLWCKLNSQFASLPQRHTVFNQSRYVIRDQDWLLSLDFYYLESFGGQFCFLCFGSDLESFGGQFFFSFVLALLDLKQRQGYILSKDLW